LPLFLSEDPRLVGDKQRPLSSGVRFQRRQMTAGGSGTGPQLNLAERQARLERGTAGLIPLAGSGV
jgi:hypothetical protein